jgi:hypothetical protein
MVRSHLETELQDISTKLNLKFYEVISQLERLGQDRSLQKKVVIAETLNSIMILIKTHLLTAFVRLNQKIAIGFETINADFKFIKIILEQIQNMIDEILFKINGYYFEKILNIRLSITKLDNLLNDYRTILNSLLPG